MVILQSWDCFSLALIWSEAETASTHTLSISVCVCAELWREVPVQIPAAVSHEHSYRTQAVYVPVVWQRLQHETVFRRAHEDTHRWADPWSMNRLSFVIFHIYLEVTFTIKIIILIYSSPQKNITPSNFF